MKNARWAVPALLVALAACAQNATSTGMPAATSAELPAGGSSKIEHIVIIFQENRTTDNLFNGLSGADTVRYGYNSKGERVSLRPIPLTGPYDLSHAHRAFLEEYNSGKMNGFNNVSTRCESVIVCTPRQLRAYGYVPHDEEQPYFDMAEQYAFGDHMFQTNEGPSFPAHQYIVSGTSAITDRSALRVAENPILGNGLGGGCDSPPGTLVELIDPAGVEGQPVYPCFNRISLMELLDSASLTWRYYQSQTGSGLWNGPDAILKIRESASYDSNVIAPSSQVLTDIAKGNLADVVWVTPTGLDSDHALSNNGSGPSWVASIVNAIGESKYWNSAAIFVTWDDWGGWFDHVKPPLYNSYELGFRVPLIVISPYAKNHYISHVQHEFGSILKFTEQIFGLPSMHTTDARADDLFDCFDFSKPPTKFKPISAKYPPSYFHALPATEPDDS
jgi:phospholipase C